MHTLEQIEDEVKLLPLEEQKALIFRLVRLVSVTVESVSETRQSRLNQFFAAWDASHSVTVGEKPSRQRTYADNSRLR